MAYDVYVVRRRIIGVRSRILWEHLLNVGKPESGRSTPACLKNYNPPTIQSRRHLSQDRKFTNLLYFKKEFAFLSL